MHLINASDNAKNNMFTAVNIIKYRLIPFGNTVEYNLYDIILAIEAISVPIPPMFTPSSKPFALSVNPESITAAGTLLTNWLATSAVSIVSTFTHSEINLLSHSILAIFPTNIKIAANVNNRL